MVSSLWKGVRESIVLQGHAGPRRNMNETVAVESEREERTGIGADPGVSKNLKQREWFSNASCLKVECNETIMMLTALSL